MSEEEQGVPPGASQAARLAGEHAGHDIQSLLARLEAATEGNTALDGVVLDTLGYDCVRERIGYFWMGPGGIVEDERITTSVDAALALAGLIGWRFYTADLSIIGRSSVWLKGPNRLWPATDDQEAMFCPGWEVASAKTFPLAVCAACLKAFMTNVSDAQSDHAAQVSPAIRDEPLNPQSPLPQDQGQ